MTYYIVKLQSKLPRRIWVPLHCKVQGANLDKAWQSWLYHEKPSLRIHWSRRQDGQKQSEEIQPEFSSSETDTGPAPMRPSPLLTRSIPDTLVEIAQQNRAGSNIQSADELIKRLDLRLAWLKPDCVGLLFTWPWDDLLSTKDWRYLTLANPQYGTSPREGEIILYIPRFRVETVSSGSFWLRALELLAGWSKRWECELDRITSLEVHESQPDDRRPAAVCLDFGTSTTASSYVREVSNRFELAEYAPMRDLYPWTHIIGKPDYENPIRPVLRPGQPREIRLELHCGERWTGNGPLEVKHLVPEFYSRHGFPISKEESRRTTLPSLVLLRKPKEESAAKVANRTSESTASAVGEKGVPGETRRCVIGFEADYILFTERLASALEFEPCYAPKLEIGRPEERKVDDSYTQSGAERPVAEGGNNIRHLAVREFLREYFDQLHSKLLREGLGYHLVERICYSYPVAWVKHQRDLLKKLLGEAVEQSYFGSRLGRQQERRVDPFHYAFSLDEASAAFLGFVQYRMRGLEGEDLVLAYQPFEPNARQVERSYPKTCWVLVVDSGGGTTDAALLKIEDPGTETDPVQSHVRQFFGMPKAGLEVTRMIASILKDYIVDAATKVPGVDNLASEVSELLRTNLNDEGLDERGKKLGVQDPDANQTLTEDGRRALMIRDFFEEAERLKIALVRHYENHRRDSQQAAEIKEEIRWDSHPYLSRNAIGQHNWDRIARYVCREFSLAQLCDITAKVFKPVKEHIQRWFEQEALRREIGSRRLNLLILAGRSSLLPGFRELILEAIPKPLRPFQFDVVTADNLFLSDPPINVHEAMKTLVQEGLRLLYNNRKLTRSRALVSNPPDQTRRSLAIGIMQEDVNTGAPEPRFHPQWPLLVEADGQKINPDLDLIYDETNPTSRGFFIGFNYTGTNNSKQHDFDPPLPCLRVRMQGGEEGAFGNKRLRYVFRQLSSSEIYLQRLELIGPHDAQRQILAQHEPPASMVEGQELEFSLDSGVKLKVSVEPYPFQEDFRLTGKIDPEKIDSDAHS